MAAAVDGVDAVGEAEHGLREAVVVLEGGLDHGSVDGALDVDGLGVNDLSFAVEAADEAGDPALEVEVDLSVLAFVSEVDPDALCEIGHLPEALGEDGEVVVYFLEDLFVGQEASGRTVAPVPVSDGHRLHRSLGDASAVLLAVGLALALHLHGHL